MDSGPGRGDGALRLLMPTLPVCPVNAIFAQDDVPARDHEFIELNARYFEDKRRRAGA